MSDNILDRMREAFLAESLDLLVELDAALLALESAPEQDEYVHRVFRAIHTMKGSGGTAGFVELAKFAHKVEEAFDLARCGRLPITTDLVDCGLKSCDVLRSMLNSPGAGGADPGAQQVIEALARLIPREAAGPAEAQNTPPVVSVATGARTAYEITIRPHRDLFYSGTDPVTLLDELRELGPAHVRARVEAVPLLADLEPECCYFWWEVLLVTGQSEAEIRSVFLFVEDQCDVSVRLLQDQASSVSLLGSVSAEMLELFVSESEEYLAAIELHALELERDSSGQEHVNALFRAVHSIKGNAGLLLGQVPAQALGEWHALPVLARIAHAVESLLEPLRGNGAPAAGDTTAALLLEARDAMEGLLATLTGQSARYEVPESLAERLGLGDLAGRNQPGGTAADVAFRSTAAQCLEIFETCFERISRGEEGLSLLKTYRRGLKTLAAAATHQQRQELSESVAAQLQILDSAMQAGKALSDAERAQLGSALKQVRSQLAAASRVAAEPADASSQASSAAPSRPAAAGSATTIRIEQEKLDRLMRVVGELLVARGAFAPLVERLSAGEDTALVARALKDAGAGISHIAEELQDSVMAIRMLPMKTVFQRFPRLVRDLARALGKEVRLEIEGEEVELDKTILEQIGDPLVHLIRNAIDHGIELPGERTASGKNPHGRIILSARNEAGSVLIEIADDGHGLNVEHLRRKAVDRGLMTAEAASAMSTEAACQLIFLPGLSTAEKVTDVSGRGVGMDVVRNNVRNLQGSIEIYTRPGQGTKFTIKLPTSLMITKGILLEAGGQEYILPLNAIRDMVRIPPSAIHVYRGLCMAQIRGQVYPLFTLVEMFGLERKKLVEWPIAVVQVGNVRYGLVVDRFVSEVEVLVKPLSSALSHCAEFGGAAIMGDGRVVLVLNPMECHRMEGVAA